MSFRRQMNRLGNARNPYQGNLLKALAVCSAGILRSPTIAWVLSNPPYNYNTRSSGNAEEFALIPTDLVLVEWADIIVCADGEHVDYVKELVARTRNPDKKVFCLGLPDDYQTREPALIRAVEIALEEQGVPKLEIA